MESKRNAAVFYRVSSEEQYSENQVPDVKQFTAHHGYRAASSSRSRSRGSMDRPRSRTSSSRSPDGLPSASRPGAQNVQR
jgi:hypothetical protein